MDSARTGGPQPGAYRALVLATLSFALCFSVWGLVAPLAPQFRALYELSSTQVAIVIATPVLLGSIFRIPMGLFTDRFGGRAVFTVLLLVLIVPVLFIGILGSTFGGLLFWGFFLGLAGSSFAVGVPFVNKWFPKHMQGLALDIYGIGNIGQAIAAYSAPSVAAAFGWQWAFWIFIIPLIVMATIFWILGRDAPSRGPSYAASQAAMRVLLRELKRELSEEGLRTSEVRLGDRQRPSPERCAEAVRYALYHPDIAVVPT